MDFVLLSLVFMKAVFGVEKICLIDMLCNHCKVLSSILVHLETKKFGMHFE